MKFRQLCRSTVTECNRLYDSLELYNHNRLMHPIQIEMSRIAFEYDNCSLFGKERLLIAYAYHYSTIGPIIIGLFVS